VRSLPVTVEATLFGDAIHAAVEDPATAIPAIEEAMRGRGIPAVRADEITPSLEDVFISAIARRKASSQGEAS